MVDDSLQDLSSKDAFLILHKCWIQELGEFERISSKRAAGEIKAFLSRPLPSFVELRLY
jgi:predicted P-loop ATPase